MATLGSEPTSKLEGRDAELAALLSALAEARLGRGRIVVITGEGGIGKSALLSALAEQVTAAGLQPLWGRAWEFADAPAYFPLWPCLSALGLARGSELSAEATPAFALWESVLSALSRASNAEPCVWLLEDLHAADLQTLDLLTFLAQPLRVLSALVVVTARPRDPRLGARGEKRLLRMARDGLDLRLLPLAADDVERLAQRYAGALPKATLQQLFELTSGNPLFVIECARSLRARGLHSLRGVAPTVRHVVLERLELLPLVTRELLESGAVLGRNFSAALLGRMQGLLPARVIDQLEPARRSGLLLERAPGSFAFSHVIVQAAIYEGLSAEHRSGLHGRARQALDALPDAPDTLLERARHALGALTPSSEASAVELVLATGQALEESGAFDRAHALYARLREKAASGELSHELSGQELLRFAAAAERAGKNQESRALSQAVIRQARSTGNAELLSLAALELGRAIRPGIVDAELVLTLREALDQLGDASESLACRLLARLSAALQPAPDPQQPVALASEAIARARKLGEPRLMLEVLDVAGSAYVDYAPLELRIRVAEDLLARALEARDFVRSQRARARLGFDRAELGDFDELDLQIAQLLRAADGSGMVTARIRPLLMASLMASVRGRAAESAGQLVEVQQLLALTDEPSLSLSYLAHRHSRALLLQLDDELAQIAPQLSNLVSGVPDSELTLYVLRGVIWARLEDRERASADLAAAWVRFRTADGMFLSLLSETAAFVGEKTLCSALHALLLPMAGREAVGGHVSVSYEGPVDRLLGLLEAALGQTGPAEQKLRATLALAERRGFRAYVARGRYDLANLLAATGRAQEARALWLAAAELAADCEMVGLQRRASARAGTPSPAAAVLASAAKPAVDARLVMEREGDLYRLERAGLSARIRATRGAELLARLVQAPDQEVHVLALAADEGVATRESNAGDVVDRSALKQYRARLRDLAELIEEAESDGSTGNVEKLRHEQAELEREIATALGLGGRARQASSTTERARVNVQRRIKDALERVSEASPELGAWLGRAVRTGTYCSFRVNS